MANVAAFNQGLRKIGERLLNHPLGYVYGLVFPKDTQLGGNRNPAALTRR